MSTNTQRREIETLNTIARWKSVRCNDSYLEALFFSSFIMSMLSDEIHILKENWKLFLESCPAGRSSTLHNKQRIYRPSYLDHGKQQKRRFTTLPDSTNPTNIRLTCLLLLISLIFVVCTLPISIRLIIADYLLSQKSTARWQMTQLSLTMLMFLNHTVHEQISYFHFIFFSTIVRWICFTSD